MDFINIDTIQTYSNEEVFRTIKFILSPRFEFKNKSSNNSLHKLYLISLLTKNITDEALLKNTINLLDKVSFLEHISSYTAQLDNVLSNNPNYSESDKVKIKAIVCSICVDCDISRHNFSAFLKNCDVPKLNIELKNRTIEYNLSEIVEFIKRKSIGFRRNEVTELPTVKYQETEIKKMIQSMEIVDYENETDFFRDDIKHLESIKKNLTQPLEADLKLKYEHIFSNNGFVLLQHILNEYVKPIGTKGRQSDLIFFYWKMYNSELKYIHQRPTEFFAWYDHKFNETSGQLKTYNSVKTPQREKDYSTALEWFKLQ